MTLISEAGSVFNWRNIVCAFVSQVKGADTFVLAVQCVNSSQCAQLCSPTTKHEAEFLLRDLTEFLTSERLVWNVTAVRKQYKAGAYFAEDR